MRGEKIGGRPSVPDRDAPRLWLQPHNSGRFARDKRHRTATKNSWAGFLHHKAAGVPLRTEQLSIAETSQITNHSFAEWYRSNSDAQGVVRNVTKA
jgi:hypothetical protein